jgi:hypothetical protein
MKNLSLALFLLTSHLPLYLMDGDNNVNIATRKKFIGAGIVSGTVIGGLGGIQYLLWILPATAKATTSVITNILIATTVGAAGMLGGPCLCGALGCLIGDGIWHYRANRNGDAHDVKNPEST